MQIAIGHINFNDLDPSLKHLSNEQIYEVITKYYDDEKVNNILNDYKILITPSKLVKVFPSVFLKAHCEKCNSQLHGELQSKSSVHMIRTKASCPYCFHKANSRFCDCYFCEQERIELEEEKREIVDAIFINSDVPVVSENDLSLEDRFYMSIILRAALSEDMRIIGPLNEISRKIAPTNQLIKEIMNTLTARNLILISEHSSLDAFVLEIDEEGNRNVSYHGYQVAYKINVISGDGNYYSMIQRLLYPDPESFDVEFCYEKWRQIALNEIEEYLLFEMNKVGYSFNLGKKSYQVFDYLLNHFSTAQIFNIIYRAVANSTRRYQAKEITKIHAQNSVITSCESQGHRAIAEKWTLKPYRRNFALPESIFSEVLFNSIMQISSLGFTEVPTIHFR